MKDMSAQRRKARASRLYAALPLFSLACVSGGIHHGLVQSYRHAVDVSREWGERSAQADALARTALEANAPGHDVFVTGDVAAARLQLAELGAAHLRERARARAGLAELPTVDLRVLAQHLERASATFDGMLLEAEGVLAAFDREDREEAARRKVAMDRQLALTRQALGALASVQSALQQRAFAEQSTRADALEWAWVLVTLVALLVAVAIGYGRRRSVRFGEAQAALERRNADLERSAAADSGWSTASSATASRRS
jgi:hypothetical protein